MKDKIVLIKFFCDECKDIISGTINSQIILHNLDNGESYTKIHCPYCKKVFYIINENGEPIDASGRVGEEDLLTEKDNPNFKETKTQAT